MKRVRVWLGLTLCCISASGQGLQPFSLPWNDATPGITNLQSWQPTEAGADGRVEVTPEGHYAANGQRIRFLGVNIAAADAFPSTALAEGHAARLARFGFNGVRLHHLEAPWDKARVLVDYSSGSSRRISLERLNRLQYFVAQLAAHGIYTDLNLLVSREFQPSDGLGPEISQMGWKDQHILGFFNAAALDLHKEYATQVLTAPNPYRGDRSFAQDPAVAFVEIMNENGLLQKWHESVLDRMPQVYRAQLRDRWNQWLRQQYDGTQAMLTSWGASNEPLGGDLLRNPLFDAGTQSWNLEQHNGAAATFTTPADYDGRTSLKVEVRTPGSATWHIQINQGAIPVQTGKVYTVSFRAKAIRPTALSAVIQEAHANWATIGPSLNFTLGTDWKQYTFTFQAAATDSNSRLNFGGFGDQQTTVWLADVHWQPGGSLGSLPNGVTLEDGNVPSVAKQGPAPTAGQQLDWVRFLLSLEKDYGTRCTRTSRKRCRTRASCGAPSSPTHPPTRSPAWTPSTRTLTGSIPASRRVLSSTPPHGVSTTCP
jgi:Carbohydrate binding domain.